MPDLHEDTGPARVTLLDVARHAGVSRSTVSLVLRESPLVADDTRRLVRASMETLGYVYNRGAANMRASRTKTIGLLVCEITNPFFAEMTAGVDNVLDAAGIAPFLVLDVLKVAAAAMVLPQAWRLLGRRLN